MGRFSIAWLWLRFTSRLAVQFLIRSKLNAFIFITRVYGKMGIDTDVYTVFGWWIDAHPTLVERYETLWDQRVTIDEFAFRLCRFSPHYDAPRMERHYYVGVDFNDSISMTTLAKLLALTTRPEFQQVKRFVATCEESDEEEDSDEEEEEKGEGEEGDVNDERREEEKGDGEVSEREVYDCGDPELYSVVHVS